MISQIAIAIILLIGAGLFSRSLMNLLHVNPGFVRQGVVALQVFLYDYYEKPESQAQFTWEAISQLKNVPGVNSVGITTALPFLDSSSTSSYSVNVEGEPIAAGEEQTAFRTVVTEDYLSLMGIPLQSGRLFESRDHQSGPPTTIINETMARRLNLGNNAIGKKIQAQLRKPTILEIIGVVGSLHHDGLDRQELLYFFSSAFFSRSPRFVLISF
ncbi:ABC transporter permease [bacterium]|nr:ABC transporter permease [bacterium]MCI0607284.1 ABC transporter permease [bacterium]